MILQIEPWIDEEELEELRKVIESTFVTENTATKAFEGMCRELTGSRHALAFTNGTVALFACLKALGVGRGDEVLLPDLTFIATANAVLMAGALPIFCDIDPKTLCLDPDSAASKLSERTKAVMPVHLYGQSADMTALASFAKDHGLYVVEDAAQGVGVKFLQKHVGSFGELGVLSFFGNKTITCGEGGIILTEDDKLAEACYRLKNHGRARKGIFVHEEIGYNFGFTEMQAAVGISQMRKLPRIIARKREIHDRYVAELSGISALQPCLIDSRTDPVFWFTSFLADDAELLAASLLKKEIQTRRFFYPLHLQPCYMKHAEVMAANRGEFPASVNAFQRGLSLPSSYLLTNEQQTTVISAIRAHYEHRD